MSQDNFASFTPSLGDPARDAFAIVPSDSTPLTIIPRALYVGTGGTLGLRLVDGTGDITFRNVAAGQLLDVRPAVVRATGTTATDVVGLV